jgi:AraC-like DNA-binding protein
MNPAYLSGLFSKAVGLPFRSYLKELRLEKARTLLADPLKRISEIARVVGYTDSNRFRLDFKALNGLSPSAWRQTLTARP